MVQDLDIALIQKTALGAGFRPVILSSEAESSTAPKTSGIYVWHTEGLVYVGKSVNLRARLGQHRRERPEIIWGAVLDVEEDKLDSEERRLVKVFEELGPMLNIKLVRSSSAWVAYDDVIHSAFEENPGLAQQTEKAANKVHRFLTRSDAPAHVRNAQTFIRNAIPNYEKTEGRFWHVNVNGNSGLRVSCGQQEVMTTVTQSRNVIKIRLLCPSRLRWNSWRRLYETDSYENVFTCGQFERFNRWEAVRSFAVQLMRQTTPLAVRSHCPQIMRYEPQDP